MLKSRGVLVVIGTLVAAGLWAYWYKITTSEAPPSAAPQKQQVKKESLGASELPPVRDMIQDTTKKEEPVVSTASIPKATMASLKEAIEGMQKFKGGHGKDRDKNRDKEKIDPEERKELAQKLKTARDEVRKLVRESEVARKQLFEAVKDERDLDVKKELARNFRDAAPEDQLKFGKSLADDSSAENQKVGAGMLGMLHTDDSLHSLVGMAENAKDDDVRTEAVMAIGRSIPMAYDDNQYQEKGKGALIDMTQSQYSPEVRTKAYQAIAMQTSLSPEDQKQVMQSIENESDPQVKRTAQFVQAVINARQNASLH